MKFCYRSGRKALAYLCAFNHPKNQILTIMKRMKTIAASLLLTLGAFTAITYTACNKDECKSVDCGPNGTCISGSCSCATGYEGSNCATESRAKFINQYTVTASCQASYVANIMAKSGTDVTQVTINNFAGLDAAAGTTTSVNATISGTHIKIPTQNVVGFSSATITASGDGDIANGVITMSYTVTAGTTVNTCTNTSWQ